MRIQQWRFDTPEWKTKALHELGLIATEPGMTLSLFTPPTMYIIAGQPIEPANQPAEKAAA